MTEKNPELERKIADSKWASCHLFFANKTWTTSSVCMGEAVDTAEVIQASGPLSLEFLEMLIDWLIDYRRSFEGEKND
jgi:hypothetical protein